MRFPGRRWASRTVGMLRARRTGSPVILGYHRIGEGGPDPFRLSVRPSHFAAHMEWLATRAAPVDLRTAAREGGGSVPSAGVAVTFDDGYAGTADAVLPVIERFEVPLTVFVTTGAPGHEFWWDEVLRLLRAAPADMAPLRLTIGDRTHAFPVREPTAGNRERLALRIAESLRPVGLTERERRLAALRAQVPGAGQAVPVHRALAAEELKRLARHPLVSIGAHSVTHPVLPLQCAGDQRREIRESRSSLQAVAQTAVDAFSYPNGRFSRDTADLVREAGYVRACCSRPAAVLPGTDPFALPRLWAGDVDVHHFERWLRRWIRA